MHLYEIAAGEGLVERPFDPQSWPTSGGAFWLEGAPADADTLLPLVMPLRPHPLLLEDLLGPNRTTLITRYDDTVYMEFPVTSPTPTTGVPYIAMLYAPGLLITIPQGPGPDLGAFARQMAARPGLAPAKLEGLLIEILGFLVDGTKQETLLLRDQVYATSDLLDEDADALSLDDFAQLRRRLRVLAVVADDQHYCVTNLDPNASHLWVRDEQKLLLRDLVNDTEYVLRSSQRLEQRLEGLHDQYQLTVHDRTEARLRVLTIISVLILPLTLITGFFGMNFPDLYLTQTPYGQDVVLVLMLVLPLLLVWTLWRRGWFD